MMSILDGVHGTGLEGTEDGLVIDKRRVPVFYRSILLDLNYLVVRRERERERWGVGDATCDPAGCSDVTLGASTSGAEQRKGVHSGGEK